MVTPRRPCGFMYLGLLVAVAVLGVGLAALTEAWHVAAQREKERELLFIGSQMRAALMQYYRQAPARAPRHPTSLEDLLRDPRAPGIRRYLRKIDPDPITGRSEWGLVRGTDGAIYGVHSLSPERPLKHARFARIDQNFAQATSYAEWVFMFSPGQAPQVAPAR